MFKHYLLFTFLYAFCSYGQQYNSEKDYTVIIDYNNNRLIIPGKWQKLKNSNIDESFVGHCPKFVSEDKKTFIEFDLWDTTTTSSRIKVSSGDDIKALSLDYFKLRKLSISEIETNKEMNFTYYKLIAKSKKKSNKIETIYYLNGFKINRFGYNIAIYSYDNEIENPRDFLINLYYTN